MSVLHYMNVTFIGTLLVLPRTEHSFCEAPCKQCNRDSCSQYSDRLDDRCSIPSRYSLPLSPKHIIILWRRTRFVVKQVWTSAWGYTLNPLTSGIWMCYVSSCDKMLPSSWHHINIWRWQTRINSSSSSYGSTAHVGPWLPLLGFLNNNLFTGLDCKSSAQPPTWRTRPPYLLPPETGWPSYTPRHWVPILVAFYDMNGLQWDYSLIPATTRERIYRSLS
jgi:hypothetical protein